jgi:hypothetical protein
MVIMFDIAFAVRIAFTLPNLRLNVVRENPTIHPYNFGNKKAAPYDRGLSMRMDFELC